MKIDKKIISILKDCALDSFRNGEIPVGAVIVDQDGNIVSFSGNERQNSFSVLGHAEILAILKAEKKIMDWRLNGYCMFVTLEPCDMCSMVVNEARLDKVYYFLEKKDESLLPNLINKELISGSEDEKVYFKKLLTDFFDNRR